MTKGTKMPVTMAKPEDSVSVRRISNGFVVSQSRFVGKTWKTTEIFSKENPLKPRSPRV